MPAFQLDSLPLIFIPVSLVLALLLVSSYIVRRRRRSEYRRELLQRIAELEALSAASRAIVEAELDLTELCRLIAAEAGRIIDASTFQIGLFEGNRYRILFWRVDGELRETPAVFELGGDSGLVGWVRERRQILHINDFASEALPAQPRYVSQSPPRSALFVPLLISDETAGVIAAQHRKPDRFSIDDRNRLSILANQAAAAIANARLYDAARLQARDLEMISSITRQVNALQDLDEIFHQVLDFIYNKLELQPVTILAIDAETKEAVHVQSSIEALNSGAARIREHEGLIGAAIRSGQTVLVNDVGSDPRFIATLGHADVDRHVVDTCAEVVLPMLFEKQVLGVLDVQSSRSGGFDNRELRVLEALAADTANAIGTVQQVSMQREQAWLTTAQLEVAQAISESADLGTLLNTIVELTVMLLGVAECGVLLWANELSSYEPRYLYGDDEALQQRFFKTDLKQTPWTALDAAHVGQVEIVTRVPPPWYTQPLPGPVRILPLYVRDSTLGVLFVFHRDDDRFTRHQQERRQELLRNIAAQTAQGVQREYLRQAQQEEAWINTALLQVAQAINSLIDLNEILNTIMRLIPLLVGIDAGIILIWDKERNAFRVGPHYGLHARENELIGEFGIEVSELLSLHEAQVESRTEISLYHAKLPSDIAWILGNSEASVVPLRARNELVGALLIGRSKRPLTDRRLSLLAGITQQAAIAVVNDYLYQQVAERERLTQEINVALGIQASLIPHGSPDIPGAKVASYWGAAQQVSGDFYDFLELPDQQWGIVIADVAGKGIPAAIFMALCRTIIRAVGFNRTQPAPTLSRANQLILADTQSDLFVTVFYAIWDWRTQTLLYCNGGHNPPLILHPDGTTDIVGGYGIALGVINDAPLEEHKIGIETGDCVIFYTDGITEAMNNFNEPFGLERLRQTLERERPETPESTIRTILDAIRSYTAGTPQSDDETMVVLKCL